MLDTWDAFDFNENGLCEMFKDQQYRRLYFDFDDMQTQDELNEILSWLNSLTCVFGHVQYAGYTTDANVHDDNIAFIKDSNKYEYHKISVHAVFPETAIDNNELYEIMKSGRYNINHFIDTKVYKETGKQQLLRHPYAPKNDRPVGFDFIECNMCKPSELVATCKGKERKVTRDEWQSVFTQVLSSFAQSAQELCSFAQSAQGQSPSQASLTYSVMNLTRTK